MVKERKSDYAAMELKIFLTFNKNIIIKKSTLVSSRDKSDFEQIHHKKYALFMTTNNNI